MDTSRPGTPGDTITLQFPASTVPAGKVRDFFLLSRGVYSSVPSQLQRGGTTLLPTRFALLQNQPNPFTRSTSIRFELPRAERVRLEVFDAQGRLLRRLADATYQPGRWSVEWDCRDASDRLAGPGIYFYRMATGSFRDQKKMVLLP
ncbi:MAG TPA: T9SS type A sorting domain-containing protein [Gemmatimonadales bacterium]|nr:T9SS type A sorting domain-containing protein [Gemmatimonadales bacterium]